jgi:hypothetical protein
MSKPNFAQIKAVEEKNKKRFLALNPSLTEQSGIYILYREENGIKFAYVGQAKHILTRLAQHLSGYQHIDLSLKNHGLATEKENGYRVSFELCSLSALDEAERYWIKYMADRGYQLRNKTLGGQDEGKCGLDNQKSSRGYYDGISQGRKSLAKELTHIIQTHGFTIEPSKHNKVTEKALNKFWELLNYENETENK